MPLLRLLPVPLASQRQVGATFLHQINERLLVAGSDSFADSAGSLTQCVEWAQTEFVQVLNFEIEMRIILGHRARY